MARRKTPAQLRRLREATAAMMAEHPPDNPGVCIKPDGELQADGRQRMLVWWLPGYWWQPDTPSGQCVLTNPDEYIARWRASGYSVKVVPSEYKLGTST